MQQVERYLSESDAPTGRRRETLDASDLPPPQPLQTTLERPAELDDATVLVQLNDRTPQHLYPKLANRGYNYDTLDAGDVVVTAIWRP